MRVDAVARATASTPGHRETPEDRRSGEVVLLRQGEQAEARKSMGGGRLEAAGPDLECEEP